MLEGQVKVATLQSPACHQAPNPNTVGFNRSQRNTWKHLRIKGYPAAARSIRTICVQGFGCVVAKPLVYGGCSGVDAGAAWRWVWHGEAQGGSKSGAF